jgi:flagellar FliJ protein
MGYRFRLEALQRFRKFQEDELQREFAEVQKLKDQAIACLNEYETQLKKTRNELYQQQNDSAQGSLLAIFPRFLERMTEKITDQQKTIAGIEKQLEAKRQALMEAMQKRKTLEKLKEKELDTYMAELSLEEQKFINEMAINRFNLKHL